MKTYYIVTKTNQEYNDEVYYLTDGGAPVRVFEGENAMELARAKAREFSILEYTGIQLWEYENHDDWPEDIFPGVRDGNRPNYDYIIENPTDEQIDYLLGAIPFYEVTEIVETE
jgi:hypothetical protein